jgi:uncharacterized membrane protein
VSQTLRPLTVGELLDRTFSCYRRHFVLFFGIAVLPHLLIFGFQIAGLLAVRAAGAFLTLIWSLAFLFLYLTTMALSQGATMVAVSDIQLGRGTSIGQAFGRIRPRLGEILIVMLNVGVRVIIGLIMLIVPGVIAVLKYALAVPVAVLEETTVSGALERSATLTKGHRGRIFLIYFLLMLFMWIVAMVWQFPAMVIIATLTGNVRSDQWPMWGYIFFQFGSVITQAVVAPIMTIAISLVYYDERVRKEAFDLTQMMQQLDRPATA